MVFFFSFPKHRNTFTDPSTGLKTRHFNAILSELSQTLAIHRRSGAPSSASSAAPASAGAAAGETVTATADETGVTRVKQAGETATAPPPPSSPEAASAASFLGGVHLELTGDAVTECTGGSEGLTHNHLPMNYTTFCDPRLNQKQALELAFLIAEQLRGGGAGDTVL
jgi:3-deoxy-D-arabino-heptulosonate 7-phosphate (DAHP) synthase class II